ncbi:MAG: asparagine synthase (glutamine-hydrolyzing) [Nitrospirae bacterium]|nr:asparagine synthase (glutamine-hydrolyzing) [Nitrospirota bacterium]
MCAIAGKLKWDEQRVSGEGVKAMCAHMAHRGPDDKGIVSLKHIVLGHRRLSIIDLSKNARQPMRTPDQRYHIVYNGEVYNFKSIRKELEGAGFEFRTSSDTEVVLYSYVHWGVDCLSRFNGMFAIAIWDAERRELFLARDRFGKKPLYYYSNKGKDFVFASELTALLKDKKDVPAVLSLEGLNCYLALGYILSPMTIYEDLHKLEPATYMMVSEAGVKKVRYWDYAAEFRNKTVEKDRDIAVRLLGLLEDSVKLRMVSDVPVGAFLSGGIDSSSIVCLMKNNHDNILHTFSIGFDIPSYDESIDAEKVADWLNTTHHKRILSIESGDIIDSAIAIYDEPFSDTSLVAMAALSKLASTQVKVVLSGDGADELFAGYITYTADKMYRFLAPVPHFVKETMYQLNRSIERLTPKHDTSGTKLSWHYKRKQFLNGILGCPEQAHYSWRLIHTAEERGEIMGAGHRELIHDTDPFHRFKKHYANAGGLNWLDRSLYVDAMTWLPDDILVKVDRASMSSGLEARCPYLDVNLASFAATIPAELKMRVLRKKHILKLALKDTLPAFILNKKKSGFSSPVGSWLGSSNGDEFKAFNRYVLTQKFGQSFMSPSPVLPLKLIP